jgi:hypothetical protein
MRPISENTYNVLKSQSMLGQNKYNYELKLEGLDQYGEPEGTFLNSVRTTARVTQMDCVIRSDGKVLAVYNIGAAIYYKIVESENDLLSTPDCLAGATLLYTMLDYDPKFVSYSTLKLKNGRILLFINERGNNVASRKHEVKVFESASGLGTDFVLKANIVSQNRTGNTSNTWARPSIGKATQLKDGSIIIAGNIGIWKYSDYDVFTIAVYKSTDNGASWTRKYSLESSDNDISRYGNIAIANNSLFFITNNNYSLHYHRSENNGDSWTRTTGNFTGIFGVNSQNRYEFNFLNVGSKIFNIHSGTSASDIPFKMSKYIGPMSCTYTDLDNPANYQLIYEQSLNGTDEHKRNLFVATPRGRILYGVERIPTPYPFVIFGLKLKEYSAPLDAISINISKGRGGANTMALSVDNANGRLNPNNPASDLYGIIGLNKQVILKQGYGDDLVEVFTGLIDSFDMKSFPHIMDISCRDLLKVALDQTVTEYDSNTLYFENQPLETIFTYLCYLAGIEVGEVEATGINITKEFSWQSYADAFQFLADLASFEYGADEYGKIYFRRDFQPDDLAIAYTFDEGVDITSLQYQLSDADLYAKVVVYGKSGETIIAYEAPFLDAAKYNILPQKIMKIDATEASTVGELAQIANRAIYLMNSRSAVVRFSAVAVPWLQIGDFIQVNETSSRSAGIYRIVNMSLKMDNKSFLMDLECYYYGDSINPGTLPETTGSQTPNATLNLIPQMTSNTAPSGVARASSVLTLYSNDYQPWNALNNSSEDLYWNANAAYGWIEYQFSQKMIIDKYMLKARQDVAYNKAMPKNWTFEGFDGEKWIVLDTRTNQTTWVALEERSFNFTNTAAYSKYRLNVSANNGYQRLQLEQLAMYYRGGV